MKNLSNELNKQLLTLDLQFFAEGEEEHNSTESADESSATNTETDNATPLTAEQVQEMIAKAVQSETDKVRTEYNKKLKAANKELESIKTEKMTDEEKLAHELQKKDEELAQLKREKLEATITAKLASLSMPVEFTQFVISQDEETSVQRIDTLKVLFDNAVTGKANELFKNRGTEHNTGVGAGSTITKEQFAKMSFTEKVKLSQDNPDLYQQLIK